MAALSIAQQHKAGKLYESGLSTQQVADHFGVGIGAAQYALRRQNIPIRTSAESNQIRFDNKPLSYSIKQNLTPDEERLKLAAVMLYWAEGYKVGGKSVDFANSDPEMVVIFRKFLSEICGADETRVRCYLYCYEGQDIEAIKQFWSSLLHIPENQFTKTYIKKAAEPGPRGPRMQQGLVHLRYSDKKLLQQILSWIEEYKNKCVGGGVVNREWL